MNSSIINLKNIRNSYFFKLNDNGPTIWFLGGKNGAL